MRKIKIGSVYKHFKNKYYVVLDIVNDCESNNEDEYRKIIIYKALYGEHLTWARSYEAFASEVDHEKYPDVTQRYRFEEIDVNTAAFTNYLEGHGHVLNMTATSLENTIEKEPTHF